LSCCKNKNLPNCNVGIFDGKKDKLDHIFTEVRSLTIVPRCRYKDNLLLFSYRAVGNISRSTFIPVTTMGLCSCSSRYPGLFGSIPLLRPGLIYENVRVSRSRSLEKYSAPKPYRKKGRLSLNRLKLKLRISTPQPA